MTRICSLIIFFSVFSIQSFQAQIQYEWEDITVTGSYPTLLDNSKFTVNSYGRIYFIGNNGRVYYAQNTSGWNAHKLSNSGILARQGSDLLSASGYLYYVGINNEVCAFYWNGSWQNKVLSTSFENVMTGTTFTIDEQGRIYYAGVDGYIYYIDRNGHNFNSSRLSAGTGVKVRTNSSLVYDNNQVFYVGTNDKLCHYWWTSSTSGFGAINNSFTTVKLGTEIVKDENGRIFWINPLDVTYVADNGTGTWVGYWWMPQTLVDGQNAKGSAFNDSKLYFSNSSDQIGCIFWDGLGFQHQVLNNTSIVRTNTFLNINKEGDVIYFGADNKLHLLKPKIYWKEGPIQTTNWKDGSGTLQTNEIKRKHKPQDLQLYPRDENNEGNVLLEGYVFGSKNITFKVEKEDFDGVITNTIYAVNVKAGSNDFSKEIKISAELSEYFFDFKLSNQSTYTDIADRVVSGDIYILGGQSNMEAISINSNEITTAKNSYGATNEFGKFSRTFNSKFQNGIKNWGNSTINKNNSLSENYDVGAIGLYLQFLIQKEFGIPTCVINGAIGGTSISKHQIDNINHDEFYFETGNTNIPKNRILGHLNTWIKEIGGEDNVKGFLWWQGESDWSTIIDYGQEFPILHNSLDQVISNEFTTYLFQLHGNPWRPNHSRVRKMAEDQRIMNELTPNLEVKIIAANGLENRAWSDPLNGVHFTLDGYKEGARSVFEQIKEDNYGASIDITNKPLNIDKVYLNGSTIELQFNQNINTIFSTQNMNNVLNVIDLNESNIIKSNPSIQGKIFSFEVNSTIGLKHVSYLAVIKNANGGATWNWNYDCQLKNDNNLGSLSFTKFPICNVDVWVDYRPLENSLLGVDGDMDISESNTVFFKTDNNEINAIWRDGNSWSHSQLNGASGTNVANDISISPFARIFYKTTSNSIESIYYDNGQWNHSDLDNSSGSNVAGDLVTTQTGSVFFKTNNNKINALYYDHSQNKWFKSNLNNAAIDVAGDLVASPNGTIFYKRLNGEINAIYYYNGDWHHSDLNRSSGNNVEGDLTFSNNSTVYYRTVNEEIGGLYYDGSIKKWMPISFNGTMVTNVASDLVSVQSNRIFYKNGNSEINSFVKINGDWSLEDHDGVSGTNVGGDLVLSAGESVFYRTNNNDKHIEKLYYGSACDPENHNARLKNINPFEGLREAFTEENFEESFNKIEVQTEVRIWFNEPGIKTKETKSRDLIIHPNPTKGLFRISGLPSELEYYDIKVYNSNGTLVFQTDQSSTKSFDLRGQSAGMYYAKITLKGGLETLKFVIN